MSKRRLTATVAVPLLYMGAAFAAAPDSYEGRALPAAVKELVWQKACDLPEAEEADCATGVCVLKRSDGSAYKPAVYPWQGVSMYEWSSAERVFGPAFAEGKAIASIDEIEGQTRLALELVSGLPLQQKDADGPVRLNPAMVRWVQKNLMPPADHTMCGGNATDVYQAAFKGAVRGLSDVYAALKKQGLMVGITVKALSQSFDTQRGRFASACKKIGANIGGQDGEYMRTLECWWWLRRAATGTAEPIAELVGEALRRYDPEQWTRVRAQFPKPPKATPAP